MAFTKEAVQELSSVFAEPEWLRSRRLEAFDLYDRLPIPDTKRDEQWKQVDLKGLDLEKLEARLTNGALKPKLDSEVARKGVVLTTLAEGVERFPELVGDHLFKGVMPGRDKFAALHAALFSGGTFLYVPDGVAVDKPLSNEYVASGTALPHTLIIAGKGSRFIYLDQFVSSSDGQAGLASGSAEVYLDEGASVSYMAVQRWGNQAWQFANQYFDVGRDAHLRLIDVALGGHFARLRADIKLTGAGGKAELKGLFFGSESQSFDFRTLQDHIAPHTESDLLFKGALTDTARSVYVGLVRVEKDARGTSANQANRNLILSDHARATSEPILEIENNDILRCSHGATVGPVDPEHLFYLASRGIPGPIAKRMLVEGFLAEILDKIPIPQAREAIEQELAARIG